MPLTSEPINLPSVALIFIRRLLLEKPLPEDLAVEFTSKVIRFQIESIIMDPSKTDPAAAARLRDCRTLTDLVRNLEKLDSARRRRDFKGIPSKPQDDETFKEELIRKLDRLIAAEEEGEGSGSAERGGSQTS